jgi:SAM-dependent methyltransferase
MASALQRFISTKTPKFFFMNKVMKDRSFTLLDVGAGNHSPSKTAGLFPKCTYYGLDLERQSREEDYQYSASDNAVIKHFYEMDLTKLEYDVIPDNHFDYINMAHVIEHLHNGDKVLEGLARKIKPGGYFYIEYPGHKSTKLPSMYGTLNFYDDKTHVRVYSYKEIGEILIKNGFEIVSSGMRRSWFYIAFTPLHMLLHLFKTRKIPASVFWDMLGFAEYVFARKKV